MRARAILRGESVKPFRFGLFVFPMAVLGVIAIQLSQAATPTSSYEAENSTKSGNVATIVDATASSGAAVAFGAPQQPSELKGWQLNSSNTGLAPHGLNCANLPVYSGSGKPASGTIISNMRITTPLDLSAGTITIEKSCIKPTSTGIHLITTTDFNACGNNGCTSARGQVTIRNSEIDGSLVGQEPISKSCAIIGVAILENNYIHDTGSGICFFNTGTVYTASAVGNFVDRMRAFGDGATTGSHNETFTIRDYPTSGNPSRSLLVKGNRFNINSGNDTGALFIQAYGGFINNVTIEDNLLEGQGYQLILEAHTEGYGSNMRVINNRFSGTGYGPGYTSGGSGWSLWTENYRNDATKVDNKGLVVNKL